MISFLKKNKVLSLLLILTCITIIIGIIFYAKLDQDSRIIVSNNINKIINNNTDTTINFIINNLFSITIIWLLGISIIGYPLIIFIYFYMVFIFSFEASALISIKGIHSIPFIVIYLCPNTIQIASVFILCFYAIHFSIYLFQHLFLHKTINFMKIMKRYNKVYRIALIGLIIASIINYINFKYIFKTIL